MAPESTLLSSLLALVQRFQTDVVGIIVPDTPYLLDGELRENKIAHLREELHEFVTAVTKEDQADALVDIAYVALGGLVQMGVCPGPIFEAVHDANMRRTKAEESADHKMGVGKPPGWEPADLLPYLTVSRRELLALYTAKVDMYDSLDLPAETIHKDVLRITAREEVVQVGNISKSTRTEFDRPLSFPDRPAALNKPAVFDDSEAAMIAKKRRKFPLWYIPYCALQMAARVFAFGARKYSADGYKRVDYKFSELTSALSRHVKEFEEGHDYDLNRDGAADKDHSGEPLIGHMLCCAMMLAWRWVYKRAESDDRPKTEVALKPEWPTS